MTTPIGSRPIPPREPSGFVESLKKGAENFGKISLFEKILTVTATIFASIPTLFIGGFFTFIACSNYFADRQVEKMDIKEPGVQSPTQQQAGKTDKTAREALNSPVIKPSTEINVQEEAKKLSERAAGLQAQVNTIDLDSPTAIKTIFKLREGLEKEKQLLNALKSKGDLGKDGHNAGVLLQKLESALSGQEEQLLLKAGVGDAGGAKRGEEGVLSLSKEVERIQQRLSALDNKIDALAQTAEDKFTKIADLNEELNNERPFLLDAYAKLKDKSPEQADKLSQLFASVESKLQEEQESFTKQLLLSTSAVVSDIQEKKLNAEFVLIDSEVDNMAFDTIQDLQGVLSIHAEVKGRLEMMEKIMAYSSVDPAVKAEIAEDVKELKAIESKLKEKVKVNSEVIKETLQEGMENAKKGIRGGKEAQAALVVASNILESFSREFNAGLEGASKNEMGLVAQQVRMEMQGIKPKGIKNIGNSCYMNSTVQALLAVPSFKEKIMNPKWPAFGQLKDEMATSAANRDQWELIEEFPELFKQWEGIKSNDPPAEVLDNILRNKNNDDEIELIRSAYSKYFVLRRLQSALQEFSTALDKSKSPLEMEPYAYALRKAIFDTGIYGTRPAALTGQHDAAQLIGMINERIGYNITYNTIRSVPDKGIKMEKTEPMGTLQIPIVKKAPDDQSPIKFQDLCNNVFKTTHIDDVNNALKVADKGKGVEFFPQYQEKIQIGGPPPENLVLQLKRFEWFGAGGGKIDDLVELPKDQIINMSAAFEESGEKNVRYKVIAAVHHGGGLGGGHYKAYLEKAGAWHTANDSGVYPPANINNELADSYVFILQRVS